MLKVSTGPGTATRGWLELIGYVFNASDEACKRPDIAKPSRLPWHTTNLIGQSPLCEHHIGVTNHIP